MKHILNCTLALALTTLLALPTFAQSTEEAIKKVCMAETQAWLDADLNAWAAAHAQHENETLAWNNDDGSYTSMVGWTDIYKAIQGEAAKAQKNPAKLTFENFKVVVQGNMAFAMYDQSIAAPDGKTDKSREYRTLLLKDGQWKILAVMAFWNYKPEVKK